MKLLYVFKERAPIFIELGANALMRAMLSLVNCKL